MPLPIFDPRFPQRLAHILQSRGTSVQAPQDLGVLGVVITIPGEAVLENVGGEKLSYQSTGYPNPAAGAAFTVQVPSTDTWLLRAAFFRYVSSAVAATRYMLVEVTEPGGAVHWRTLHPSGQAASVTVDYSAIIGVGQNFSNLDRVFPLPSVYVPPLHTIRIYSREIQAGDQISLVRLQFERFGIGTA